jgi:hypothetical protein
MTTPTTTREPGQNVHGATTVHGDEPQREVTIEPAEHPKGERGTCSCCYGPAPVGVKACAADAPEAFVFWCPRCGSRIGAAAPATLDLVNRIARALYLEHVDLLADAIRRSRTLEHGEHVAITISEIAPPAGQPWADLTERQRASFLERAKVIAAKLAALAPDPEATLLPGG